jgi:hypothetical protein
MITQLGREETKHNENVKRIKTEKQKSKPSED